MSKNKMLELATMLSRDLEIGEIILNKKDTSFIMARDLEGILNEYMLKVNLSKEDEEELGKILAYLEDYKVKYTNKTIIDVCIYSDKLNLETVTEHITEMLTLQSELNYDTNGKQWLEGITNKNRFIDFKLCIGMEVNELIDSLNWKHWKDIHKEHDIVNLHVELVDAWHFVMAQVLIDCKGNIGKATSLILSVMFSIGESKMQTNSVAEIIKASKKLVSVSYEEELKEYDSVIKERTTKRLVESFFTLHNKLYGEDITPLYNLYRGKQVLNKFRQDFGYSSGEYVKTWFGLEDNLIMIELLTVDNKFNVNLYNEMKEIYNFINPNVVSKDSYKEYTSKYDIHKIIEVIKYSKLNNRFISKQNGDSNEWVGTVSSIKCDEHDIYVTMFDQEDDAYDIDLNEIEHVENEYIC